MLSFDSLAYCRFLLKYPPSPNFQTQLVDKDITGGLQINPSKKKSEKSSLTWPGKRDDDKLMVNTNLARKWEKFHTRDKKANVSDKVTIIQIY